MTDGELKEKLVSLFLSQDFEQKALKQKELDKKSPVKTQQQSKIIYNDPGRITQNLIDNGLAIHEKELNKIFMQTLKQRLNQQGPIGTEPNKKTVSSKLENTKPEVYNDFNMDFLIEAQNKRLLAESSLLKYGELEKNIGVHRSNRNAQTRLDQASKRLLRNLEYFSETAVLSTAQKGRELDILMKTSHLQEYNLGASKTDKNQTELFRLQDLIPNQYNIIDVDSIKIKKLS